MAATRPLKAQPPPGTSWQSQYLSQTYALDFNGVNDFVELPAGLHSTTDGLLVDLTFRAHLLLPRQLNHMPLPDLSPPGGGVLLSACDRPSFGRGRRIQRMRCLPLLWIETSGRLQAALPCCDDLYAGRDHEGKPLLERPFVADGQWHRLRCSWPYWKGHLGLSINMDGKMLWPDIWARHSGEIDQSNRALQTLLASDSCHLILGCGFTEHRRQGAAVPFFGCHSLHGSIHSALSKVQALLMPRQTESKPQNIVLAAPRCAAAVSALCWSASAAS